MAAPVRQGEELELQIDSLAYGGNGVGRLNGFVVFVRGAFPGDRVRAKVTKVKRGFAEASASEVLQPSASRIEAPCPHFGVCGGGRSPSGSHSPPGTGGGGPGPAGPRPRAPAP